MRAMGLGGTVLAAFALASPAFAALTVSKGATSNVSCVAGVCTATAADAVLNAKDFRRMLGAGDLTVASGSAAQDIVIDAKVQWTKAHRLTLDSYRGITFMLELASEGGGGVTLTTNDGGSGGALAFAAKGKLTFWDVSSGLVIDGTAYTLANDIAKLASDIAANPSGAFAFGRGYDASADGTHTRAPILTPLAGAFNGLGHAIDNLTIDRVKEQKQPAALFASILAGATVSDIALDAASVTSAQGNPYVALFAGTNAGTIRNVSVSGSVHASARDGYAAGLVGSNSGLVDRTRSSGTIDGGPRYIVAAGLVGLNSGTVSRSTSSMGVGAATVACGLVGGNTGTVTLSSATGGADIGTPHNSYTEAGGLVCENNGTISQSFSTEDVYAGYGKDGESHSWYAYGGGLAAGNTGTIQDCYAFGSVDALPNLWLGGLASGSTGTIATSYSAAAVTATPVAYTGGLIGQLDARDAVDTDTYWDLDASGISDTSHGAANVPNAPGIAGLTTAQFQSGLPAGFDPSIWAQSPGINNGYPYLLDNPPQ